MEPTTRGRGRPPGVRYPQKISVYDTEEGVAMLQALAHQRGISGAAVVRQLVREEVRRVGITVPPPSKVTGAGRSREEPAWGDVC
jgi:hypothetical protein